MQFVATGTLQIAAPGRSLTIVVFGNHKRGPATAGDEIHFEPLAIGRHVLRAVYNPRVPRPRLSKKRRDEDGARVIRLLPLPLNFVFVC